MNITEHTKTAALFTQLVLDVFWFNGRLIAAGDELTKPLDLTSALWQVLGAVRDGAIPMAQIARNMGLSRQGVRRSTKILMEKGLVRFEDNPDHQRAKLVVMTGKGRELYARIDKQQVRWANAVSKEFSEAELSRVIHTIKALGEKL